MHVADVLDDRIRATGSIACVGLDPRPSLLPPGLASSHAGTTGHPAGDVAAAFLAANRAVIDAIADRCAAVKPQAACYEAYGAAGWDALVATIDHARDAGIPVILDAKRGDMGATATHYGQAAFGGAPDLAGAPVPGIGADWLTVNAFLGSDTITAILDHDRRDGSRGIFVLVKTSNPSGHELQDLAVADGGTVSDEVAAIVHRMGKSHLGRCGLSDIGAVVGATRPAEATALRALLPDTLFLVPGYGAQGASAADALAGARRDGRGVLVSSSRGITGAWQDTGTEDVGAAARVALDAMNADLDAARP